MKKWNIGTTTDTFVKQDMSAALHWLHIQVIVTVSLACNLSVTAVDRLDNLPIGHKLQINDS